MTTICPKCYYDRDKDIPMNHERLRACKESLFSAQDHNARMPGQFVPINQGFATTSRWTCPECDYTEDE